MMDSLAEIPWLEPLPAFLTVIMISLSYSIANGLAFGVVSYARLQLVRGEASRRDWLICLLSELFIIRFIYLA